MDLFGDTRCAVCGEWGEEDASDPLLSCACGLWVHAHCYGPQYMLPPKQRAGWDARPKVTAAALAALARARPAHAFRCAVCVADLPVGTQRPCRVCLRNVASRSDPSLRAAKPLVGADPAEAAAPPPGRGSAWVHISCALWCPGAFFYDPAGKDHPTLGDEDEGGEGSGGGGALRREARCFVCEAAGRPALGVPLRCAAPKCPLTFHMICGRELGWEMVTREDAAGGVDLRAFCGSHSTLAHLKEAQDGELEACEQCGKGDRPAELLICEGCNKGWHMRCATPPLDAVPAGDWFCARCSRARDGEGGGGGGGSAGAAAAAVAAASAAIAMVPAPRGPTASSSSSSAAASAVGGAGGAGAAGASADAAGRKRPRGVDADVPNTYFTHHRLLTLKDPPPVPPPFAALQEAGCGDAGCADPTQLAWAAAGARSDRTTLFGSLLPMLRGGGSAAVTVTSVGDPLPASWCLAISFAEAEGGDARVMMADLGARGGGGGTSEPGSLKGGALVALNFGEASAADWDALPAAKLLVLVANDPHDLLAVPPGVLAGRNVVRARQSARTSPTLQPPPPPPPSPNNTAPLPSPPAAALVPRQPAALPAQRRHAPAAVQAQQRAGRHARRVCGAAQPHHQPSQHPRAAAAAPRRERGTARW
jgi:hypothetical protein